MKIPLDENIPSEQQVKVFGNRTRQRVFDRDNRNGNLPSFKPVEDFSRTRTRNNRAARQHTACGLVAERPGFALNSNFHLSTLAIGIWRKQILFEYQSVHAIRIVTRDRPQHVIQMALVERDCGYIVHRSFEPDRSAFCAQQTGFGGTEQRGADAVPAGLRANVNGNYVTNTPSTG